MVYEEKDVKKAVEAARQFCCRLKAQGSIEALDIMAPESFYNSVVALAREPEATRTAATGATLVADLVAGTPTIVQRPHTVHRYENGVCPCGAKEAAP